MAVGCKASPTPWSAKEEDTDENIEIPRSTSSPHLTQSYRRRIATRRLKDRLEYQALHDEEAEQ